ICDNFLICDTTYYLISVTTTTPSLIATPDLDTSSINSPITINVLGNDSIPNGTITAMDLIILDGTTSNSTQTINPDGTILFTPDTDFCGEESQFQYRICNTINCDTATVRVYVSCAMEPPTRMRFYTGFSPNGDGVNDFFRIEGIADYPNNELSVFNRWGTQVFRMKGYKNAWDGTWENSILPNGTYFYFLKDGNGAQYSGYVQLQR
ncbi:MAG: gliding motility-associated C-terminal domain-containing protein, partial [Bacteroidota bacterium]